MHDRSLPVALAVCLSAAAGLPSSLSHAQGVAAGNPVDLLPAPVQLPQPAAPAATIDTQPAPAPTAQQVPVTPLRFEIEGVKSIPFEEVAALFAPFAGKPTTVAKLAETARQATALYQQRGYALSFVYVPQQDFRNGAARVVAVEGFIDKVSIDGDAGGAAPKLLALAERIRADRPLRLEVFERYTQLMAQLPGVKVQANAQPPASTDGAGAMVLKVVREPYTVSASTDIRSSRLRAVVTGNLNDPMASGSRLSASTLVGDIDNETFVSAAYTQMLGSDGLVLKAEMSLYKGDPDAHFDNPPPIRRYTTYKRAELSLQYPLKLTRSESLNLSGGVYGVNNVDDYSNPANGITLNDEVNSRAVFVQAAYNKAEPTQARTLVLRLARGIDGLGATSGITTNGPGPTPVNPARLDFTRVLLEGSQRNRWGKTWGTAFSFSTQYSGDVLPSSERISFGGNRFGRAYASGEVSGDKGWGVGAEVNFAVPVGMKYLKQVQPYLLVEAARVSRNGLSLTFDSLQSASVGLRLTDSKYYSLDVALSKPVGDASPNNPSRDLRASTMLSYSLGQK
ncbi:MAG: POTRA domain-containing protein [Polaromonas sp.]|nr:POTRA domain-containing protein [Polaromonas sp.]